MSSFDTLASPWQVLTNRDPVGIEDSIAEEHDADRFEDVPAEKMAQPNMGWPSPVASAIKKLYTGLCLARKGRRVPLQQVVEKLTSLLDGQTEPEAAQAAAPEAAGAGTCGSAGASSAAAQPYVPSPLTMQVRAMRPATVDPVKKHVIDAFHSLMDRLGQQHIARDAEAPPRGEFKLRLHFWHEACGMPSDVHNRMQTLRKWRNAADKLDDARWASEGGPSSRDAAEQFLVQLSADVDKSG